jgi:6-phosphogluconolactonase (cycloisomerase 2 family)
MEIKPRMSNRFAWVFGALVLVSIALLVACGSNYSVSNDGLVVTSTQGAAALQTFSFDLASGHTSAIYNPPSSTASSTCILPGVPSSIVLDPPGAFAYAIITANSACTSSQTGIMGFKVNSDGTMAAVGSTVTDANPIALAMDSSGKFLFVAEGLAGGVNVYGVSSGSLTAVAGTFTFPATAVAPNLVSVAATPMVFPALTITGTSNSVCSSQPTPTSEYLYAADAANNMVWEFSVDTSTGALGNPAGKTLIPSFAAGSVPGGVTVDACNRFVYVSNQNSNNVSAYTICNGSTTQSSTCPVTADGSLVEVSGSPFSLSGGANGPGPLLVDPFGNYLYIVDTLSNQLSGLHISPISGSLTDLSPAVVTTGTQPKSIAIRSDDSWIFVANFASATLSQYAVTPATGGLTPQTGITTDNYPWGVAVK